MVTLWTTMARIRGALRFQLLLLHTWENTDPKCKVFKDCCEHHLWVWLWLDIGVKAEALNMQASFLPNKKGNHVAANSHHQKSLQSLPHGYYFQQDLGYRMKFGTSLKRCWEQRMESTFHLGRMCVLLVKKWLVWQDMSKDNSHCRRMTWCKAVGPWRSQRSSVLWCLCTVLPSGRGSCTIIGRGALRVLHYPG